MGKAPLLFHLTVEVTEDEGHLATSLRMHMRLEVELGFELNFDPQAHSVHRDTMEPF